MKQSSNAIKYLLAQYRAIFKHAYLKGLVSAAVLTTGLAVGATATAVGTNITDKNDWDEAFEASDTITINGEEDSTGANGLYKNLSLTLTNDTSLSIGEGKSLVITDITETDANTISISNSGATKTVNIDGNGSLVLDAYDNNLNLIAGDSGAINVDLGSIELKAGNLILNSKTTSESTITLNADTITVGDNSSHRDGGSDTTLHLHQGKTTSGDITLGSIGTNQGSGSTLIINKDGKVRTGGASGSTLQLKSEVVEVNNGAIVLDGSTATTISSNKVTFNGGSFEVRGDATATVALEQVTDASGNAVLGTMTFDGTADNKANVILDNVLTVNKGIITFGENSQLVAKEDTDSGSIILGAGTGNSETATLNISSENLASFVNSSTDKGGILLKTGSTLNFTSDVDLYSFFFSGDSNATDADAGLIIVSGNGLITGENITVSNTLRADASNTSAGLTTTNQTLEIKATNLTLGSNGYDNTQALGFAKATAKNVEFIAESGENDFVLRDTVVLRSTRTITSGGKEIEVSDTGSIVGDVIVSGNLTVDGGKYTSSNNFAISSGSLIIQNTDAKFDESSLTLDNLKIDLTGSTTVAIKVDGQLDDEYDPDDKDLNKLTQLDLTNGFNVSGAAGTATLTAESGGIILLDADDMNKVFDAAGSSTSYSKIKFAAHDGGKLVTDGDLKIVYNSGNGIAQNAMLNLSGDGILEANGMHLIYEFDNDGSVGGLAGGEVRVNNMTFENTGDAQNLQIGDGTYRISDSFTLKGANLLLSSPAATGYYDITVNLATETADGTGTITTDSGKSIIINEANSKPVIINVAQGAWTASNTIFDLQKGTINVGNTTDPDDTTFASLTAAELKASGGSVNINSGSTATFDKFTQTSTNITVNGVLNINGKHTAADSGAGTPESWGVDTSKATGTITVAGNNAVLNFGADAVGNISLSGDQITYASGDTFAKNITLESFATLKLGFTDSEMVFTEAGLKNLRQEFISGSTGGILTSGFIDLGKAKIEGVEVSGGTISWNDLEKVSDIIADIKTEGLSEATLTNVEIGDIVNANVGNILASGSTSSVTVGKTTLNSANASGNFVVNEKGELVDVTVTNGGSLVAYNGGNLASVNLSQGTTANDTTFAVVSSGDAVTNIENISGSSGSLVEISGTTHVEKDVKVENLNVDQALTVTNKIDLTGDLTSTSRDATSGKISAASLDVDGKTFYAGSLDIAGNANFEGKAYLGGASNIFNGEKVTFNNDVELDRGFTKAKKVILDSTSQSNQGNPLLEVIGNAELIADSIAHANRHQAIDLVIGEESGSENGESWESAAGYLTVGSLALNGGSLRTDPEYGKSATLVAVDYFDDQQNTANHGNDAGTLNGQIIALRNSIVGIGVSATADETALESLKSTFSTYLDANGSLDKDNVGSIVYVAKSLDIDRSKGSKIIVDGNKTFSSFETSTSNGSAYDTNVAANDIYLGSNSVLAISDEASLNTYYNGAQRAAIEFNSDGASLYAENGAKIVLTGDDFSTREKIMLFKDAGTNGHEGIKINGSDVTVETINGLLSFTLKSGSETTGDKLSLNEAKIDSAFTHASAPVKYSLISYAANDNNWEYSADANVHEDPLHGALVTNIKFDPKTETFTDKDDNSSNIDQTAYTVLKNADGSFAGDKNGNVYVYREAYNYFLDSVVRNSLTGIEAEQAARLSIYGGTAQAALSAGATTYDAISGRMGVGAQYGSITFADNGQGAGLWVSPIYKSHDSDGFGAQGPSYGVDMSMYGLALGGDFTMANGMRFGGAFNVGSGDADGQGVGAGVSNDFDYVSFAVYGGFSMDKFSVIGDISYTMVDNDVKANTSIEQISASMDSSSLSVGVTGQYALDLNGLSVVPHAGLRYTSIDMDDYTVKGSADIAYYGADRFNVFSIPVGVTVAKEITAGTWTVKPAFDLTLTANMGDDAVNGSVAWAGIENLQTNVESEVVDSFTYGATLGVSAKSGNMSLGFGVNYTGASSADEYGVQANARFVF